VDREAVHHEIDRPRLQRKLAGEMEQSLALTMHFPTSWIPTLGTH
jgi:hypothetical protein